MTTVQERPTAAAAPALLPDGSPRPGTARLALVLGAFVALGPLTIDMYLPALPTHHRRAGHDLGDGAADAHRHADRPRRWASSSSGRCRTRWAAGARCWPGPRCTWSPRCWCSSRRTSPSSVYCACSRASGTAAGAVIAHGDRPRPVHRPGRGDDAVAAVPRARRGAGARPDRRRGAAAVHRPGAASSRCSPPTACCCWSSSAVVLRETLPPERRATAAGCAAPCAPTACCCATAPTSGLVLVAGLTMAGAVQLRLRLVVRLPGGVRARRAAVRPAVRRRGVLADRGHPAEPGAAPPLVARAAAGRRHGRRAVGGRRSCVLAATGDRWPARRVASPVGGALRLRAGPAQRPRAGAVAARRGRGHGRRAARRGPVRRRRGRSRPLVGVLGNDAAAMGTVVVGALVLAMVVLGVVRPWRLTDADDVGSPVPSY